MQRDSQTEGNDPLEGIGIRKIAPLSKQVLRGVRGGRMPVDLPGVSKVSIAFDQGDGSGIDDHRPEHPIEGV